MRTMRRKAIRSVNRGNGFSLIEVLVSSVVFLVIFMGLATALQSMMMVNYSTGGLGDCFDQYRVGMRLLKFGDNNIGSLVRASAPFIDANGYLGYQNGGNYLLWVQNGELRRGLSVANFSVIMGEDKPDPVVLAPGVFLASPGVRLFPDTASSTPVATIVSAANGSRLVTFSFRLYKDLNGNMVPDADEPEVTLSPAVFLRNTDL